MKENFITNINLNIKKYFDWKYYKYSTEAPNKFTIIFNGCKLQFDEDYYEFYVNFNTKTEAKTFGRWRDPQLNYDFESMQNFYNNNLGLNDNN